MFDENKDGFLERLISRNVHPYIILNFEERVDDGPHINIQHLWNLSKP